MSPVLPIDRDKLSLKASAALSFLFLKASGAFLARFVLS